MDYKRNKETGEYFCLKCGSKYLKYNSLFNHNKRKHSLNDDGNIDKRLTVNESSRDGQLRDITRDNKAVNESVTGYEGEIDRTLTVDKNIIDGQYKKIDKSLTEQKRKAMVFMMLLFVGVVLLLRAYERGWFRLPSRGR
jgi:hypothetical protein